MPTTCDRCHERSIYCHCSSPELTDYYNQSLIGILMEQDVLRFREGIIREKLNSLMIKKLRAK